MDNQDSKLISLLLSSLVLLGVTILLGVGIMVAMQNPEAFAREATPAMAVSEPAPDPNLVENGIDVATGFIAEGDYLIVKSTCTACHSAKLVTQNRATRDGWLDMIRWMQRTQKLWDLGDNEDKILDYLAKHYGPEDQGRRAPLNVEEWYALPSQAPPRGGGVAL